MKGRTSDFDSMAIHRFPEISMPRMKAPNASDSPAGAWHSSARRRSIALLRTNSSSEHGGDGIEQRLHRSFGQTDEEQQDDHRLRRGNEHRLARSVCGRASAE